MNYASFRSVDLNKLNGLAKKKNWTFLQCWEQKFISLGEHKWLPLYYTRLDDVFLSAVALVEVEEDGRP
jgi:hypothetical protein